MCTTIYYFTGTGNSLKIAKDLKDNLEDTKLVQICKNNMQIGCSTESEKIGFVFPVYYRGLPHMVSQFIKDFQFVQDTYIFAVANYGGSPAIAFDQIEKLLFDKGTKLSATFGLSMPGNMWFMYYPHPKQDFTDRIDAQKEKTLAISQKIGNKSNEKVEIAANKSSEEIYAAFQPNRFDENFWTDPNCTGCETCARICPANNIKIVDKKPAWLHQCEQCLACIHLCPESSIQYKNDSLNKERYQNPGIQVKELFQY